MIKKTALVLVQLIISMSLYSQALNLDQKIQLENKKYLVKDMIAFLETNYKIKFAYNAKILDHKNALEFSEFSITLQEIIDQICKEAGLEYKIVKGQIVLKGKEKSSKVTISGYILDASTGEALPGANIRLADNFLGTSSNNYGFYSLSMPVGESTIIITYVGFKTKTIEVSAQEDQTQLIKLDESDNRLEEVKVVQDLRCSKTRDYMAGKEHLTIKEIESLPAFLGEVDVLKGFQHLPGVQSVNDGISLISVRGGTFDQNLIILDEAPVYNPTHVLGFFSVFNPDAVIQADFYKGYIPANFGGRLSSVIDIRMKEGNRKKLSVTANVNLYASRLTIETPVKNENTSILVSGRYANTSLVPNLGNLLANGTELLTIPAFNNYPDDTKINFWDFNAKVNHRLDNKNQLFLSGYFGHDYFFYPMINKKSSIEWGNSTATLRWNHIYNHKLFSNTSLVYSNYKYTYLFTDNGYSYNWDGGMREFDIKSDFDWYVNAQNRIKFGFSVNRHGFQPGRIEPLDTASSVLGYELERKNAWEQSMFISHKFSREKFTMESGLRLNDFYTHYNRDGVKLGKNYPGLAPRFTFSYALSNSSSAKFAYSRTYQYLHLLKNASIGFPTDIWLPSDVNIKPQSADQLSLGYYTDVFKGNLEFSTEVYYKKMHDIIDFIDNADLFLKENIETQIRAGEGQAYGLELMLSKKQGKFTGNVSYTLAKAEKNIPGVNNGATYPFANDNRHLLNANINLQLGKRWVAMANFTYKSGAATTIMTGYYFYEDIPFAIYSSRNGYRLPAYHTLDIAFTRQSKPKENRNWVSEWSFGVNNVYNRKNTFAVFFYSAPLGVNVDEWGIWDYRIFGVTKQLYLFGALPFVSYSIKF